MKTKFTKWKIWGGYVVQADNRVCIADVYGLKVGNTFEENAHLIAAAPELYEALNKMVEASSNHFLNDEDISIRDLAEQALANARGEQNKVSDA